MPSRKGRSRPDRHASRPTSHRETAVDRPAGTPPHRPLVLALALVAVLQVGGTLVGSNWLWGVQALRFWDFTPALCLALLGLAGFIPPVARGATAGLRKLGAALERGGWIADLLVAAGVGALLFVVRDPLRFTGDSSLRLQAINFVQAPTTLFPQASPLDVWVNFRVPRFLVGLGWKPETALHFVSALVGFGTVVALLRTLRVLGARGAAYVAGIAVTLSGAHLTHFAGYDKFGPVMLGVAFATLGAVKLSRADGGAWWLALGSALCVLGHRSGLLVVPAAALTFVQTWRTEPSSAGRARLLVAVSIPAIAVAFVLPRALATFTTLDLRVHLPGSTVQRSLGSPDAPAVAVRVSDFLNALLLLAPLWPAGFAASWRAASRDPARSSRFGLGPIVALALGAQALLFLLVGATRGSGRDWDVAAPAGVIAAIATAGAFVAAWRSSSAGIAAAVSLATAISVAIWGIHADEIIGGRRVDALLMSRPAWSATSRAYALDLIGLRAVSLGRYEEAAAAFEKAIEAAPNARYFHQLGWAYLYAGRPDLAREPLRVASRRDPGLLDVWITLARAEVANGDTAAARVALDSAAVRPGGVARVRGLREVLGAPP